MHIPRIEYIRKYKVSNRIIYAELIVDENGNIQDAKITRGSGNWRLDRLVKQALLDARFKPAYNQKRAIKIKFPLKIEIR